LTDFHCSVVLFCGHHCSVGRSVVIGGSGGGMVFVLLHHCFLLDEGVQVVEARMIINVR